MRRLRFLVVVVLATMIAAACGGDAGVTDTVPGSDTSQPAPDATNPPQTSPPDQGGTGGDDSEGSGPSTATVTIGGETFSFSTEGALVAQCKTDLFGIFSVQLPMADGGDGGIQIVALHPDTDPAVVGQNNVVQVTVGDVDWVADPEDLRIAGVAALEGKSQVDSVEFDGRTVRGTASFVGSQSLFDADSEMATGTFEATCGEERLS